MKKHDQNGFTTLGVAHWPLVELAAPEQQDRLSQQGHAWARTLKPFSDATLSILGMDNHEWKIQGGVQCHLYNIMGMDNHERNVRGWDQNYITAGT